MHPLDLSIIIPAFNEERRLPQTLDSIGTYLKTQSLRTEILVVDDGSSDGTVPLAASYAGQHPNLRVLSNGKNRGKGYSVRHGMLEARGEYALFTDADLSTPIEEVGKLLEALREQGNDVAIGSRALNRNLILVHQSKVREQAGILFNFFVRWIMGIELFDTQCGFKAFRREAAHLVFGLQRIERWGFDPEILFIGIKRGLRITEVPVTWGHDERSRISYLRDGMQMLLELVFVRWNALRGVYRRQPVEFIREPAVAEHGSARHGAV